MRRTQDANQFAVNFGYDAFGSLKSVTDSASNNLFTATYDYGAQPFQRVVGDMDRGSWHYTYNALGEVTNYSDANGAAFTLTYDDLSRLRSRAVAGESTAYFVYGDDPNAHNIGQMASVYSAGNTTETYFYDAKGRLSTRRIVSDATYDYDYAYDPNTGALDTLTYPTSTPGYRLKVQYLYQNGELQKVKDFNASTVFWQAGAVNARGQVTQENFGNGIQRNRSFDAVTGWVNSIQAGVGGGAGVQNEAYLFDEMGNVKQRQNIAAGLTENFYYDNAYRMTQSVVSGGSNSTVNYSYDAMGNIAKRSDIGSNAQWVYDPVKRHAVVRAGDCNYTYTYDANGNAIVRHGLGISWDKYNYPTYFNGNGENVTLSYDASHQRWRQIYVNGSTTETTIYVGELLEKVTVGTTVDWRHYIKAGGQTVAVHSRSGATVTTRYVLEDHQGSVAALTSSGGANYVSESFGPFGERRNPLTWSGAPGASDLAKIEAASRMGYTGHDALGRMGLNHMNGRVQDAITGRFLSADPYISEPGNTQNYNRYSYVYNNPLSNTDPSGFEGENDNPRRIFFSIAAWAGYRPSDAPYLWLQDMGYRIPGQDKDWIRKEGIQGIAANAPGNAAKSPNTDHPSVELRDFREGGEFSEAIERDPSLTAEEKVALILEAKHQINELLREIRKNPNDVAMTAGYKSINERGARTYLSKLEDWAVRSSLELSNAGAAPIGHFVIHDGVKHYAGKAVGAVGEAVSHVGGVVGAAGAAAGPVIEAANAASLINSARKMGLPTRNVAIEYSRSMCSSPARWWLGP